MNDLVSKYAWIRESNQIVLAWEQRRIDLEKSYGGRMRMAGQHWWFRSLCGQLQPKLLVVMMKLDELGSEIANGIGERWLGSLEV